VTALSRREFLAATATVVSSTRLLHAASKFRFVALGQSLILRNLRAQRAPAFDELRKNIAGADVVFSNLEGSIGHPGPPLTPLPAAPPIVADPVVLESLHDLSINLLSLANNHSDDGGRQGFLDTIRETRRRGFAVAGTGQTLAEASAPAYLKTGNGIAALVAMASNALGPEAMATETTVGVNHVAVRGSTVDPADADRILASIAVAAAHADRVFVYQHDHYWPSDWQDTPEWKKAWCRACIDAGATAFISHGVPLLHGIEIYKGRPIFYGLGNFIFHLAIHLQGNLPAMYMETPVWQSVIAHCEFDGGTVRSIALDPISLKSDRGIGEGNYMLHGNPRLAAGQEAMEILERLQALSKRVGTNITIAGGRGRVRL
jgi:poly-gamma-glutamate synthesis protein (capsule biosynthesis protein)